MPKDHRLKTQKHALPVMVPLNFLLGCSQQSLDQYELARLAELSDTRKEFHLLFDRLVEQSALAMLARWFRESDRSSINAALALEEDPLTWAKRQISERGRSEEELIPLRALPLGAAHLAAAKRYAERNIAQGKCERCPQPLDHDSVRYCTKHLAAQRMRYKPMGAKDEAPGSVNYLYQDQTPEKRQGRQPGTLASLATAREQKTRAVAAELGIPPGTAAPTMKAAKESLLANMPESINHAMSAFELFAVALIPSTTTGQIALRELVADGLIQHVGKGVVNDPCRYWGTGRKAGWKPAASGKDKNSVLLRTLRGEDPSGEK
jgi:hypothetical protein